jgi:RNA polymerase sigma-70 factor (ECF subfamily)
LKSSENIRDWVEKYTDSLFNWAFSRLGNREEAEDLIQETFLVAFQSYEKFTGKSEPLTWLHGILRNKIADHYRKVYREKIEQNISLNHFFDEQDHWKKNEIPLQWQEESVNLSLDEDFNRVLNDCLNKLPENYRNTVVLKYLNEKEGIDIRQELGISTTNYWQMIHRAKLQLRKCLEINWFGK